MIGSPTLRRDPPAAVGVSEALELLIGMSIAASLDQVPAGMLETGKEWFASARTELAVPVRRELNAIGRAMHGLLGLTALSGRALRAPTAADLVASLEAAGPDELWAELLEQGDDRPPATMAASLVRYLHEPARAHDIVAGLARAWYEGPWQSRWPVILPVLERASRFALELSLVTPVPELFERLTNGVEYWLEPGIDRVVFVPSYLMRPRAYHARRDRDFVIAFPAPDEAVAEDPDDGRRARAVKVARALADDTRLRALRFLADGPASLQEMADAVGVRKSTMHHHLGALRSAGLLLISMHEKRYRLRTAAIGEANAALTSYLTPRPPRRRRQGG